MGNTSFLACSLSLVIACGGTTPGADAGADAGSGPNQVLGLVNGKAFDAKEAMSNHVVSGLRFSSDVEVIELTDYAGACADAGSNTAPTGSLILALAVGTRDAQGKSTVPTGPGTFTLYSRAQPLPVSTNVADVYYGSGCQKSVSFNGISGTITISSVTSDGSFAGTFDVMISCAGFDSCAGPDAHLTGMFSSTTCTALSVNRTPTCS
jgi:hypothetical protein